MLCMQLIFDWVNSILTMVLTLGFFEYFQTLEIILYLPRQHQGLPVMQWDQLVQLKNCSSNTVWPVPHHRSLWLQKQHNSKLGRNLSYAWTVWDSNNAVLVRGRWSHNSYFEPTGLIAQHAGLDVALLSGVIFLKVWKKSEKAQW